MLHIGRNILSLIISRILAGIILFLIYTRLAQYLGPEAAGQYGLLSSMLMVFSLFVDLGMHQLVMKKVSENKQESSAYLNNFFFAQLLMGSMFALIMAAFVYFADYPQLVKNALYVTSLGLWMSSLSLPFRVVISSFQHMTIIARVNFVNSLINGAFMLAAILLHKNIFFLAFISVSVSLFDLLVYWYFVEKHHYAHFRLRFQGVFIRQLFTASVPFMLLTFFSIYNRIDAIMLPHFRSFEETGYYAAAYKFWDVLAFLPAVIGLSLYPFFAESMNQGRKEDARNGLETYTRYMIGLALPLAVGAYVLADRLTLAFYGPLFSPAAPALWILTAAVAVLFIYSPVGSFIVSQQTRRATKITGFTLLFNFTTNLLLIPKYGFVAAAATTLASEIIQMIGYTYVIRKHVVDFAFFRHFIKPMIASAFMFAVLFLVRGTLNVWLDIFIGAAVYALILGLSGFFHKQDFEIFRAAIKLKGQSAPSAENTTQL